MIKTMKKGAKLDWKELKIGSYKLLTGAAKLLALDRNLPHNEPKQDKLPMTTKRICPMDVYEGRQRFVR